MDARANAVDDAAAGLAAAELDDLAARLPRGPRLCGFLARGFAARKTEDEWVAVWEHLSDEFGYDVASEREDAALVAEWEGEWDDAAVLADVVDGREAGLLEALEGCPAAECAWLPEHLDVVDGAADAADAPWLAEYRAAVAAAAAATPATRKRAARWLARQERFVADAEAAAEVDVAALEASIAYNVARLRRRTSVGAVDARFARHFAAAWRAAPRRPEQPPTDLDDDDDAALRPRLPWYRGPAAVAVARTEARVEALARSVRDGGDAVVGFDVEYATLEGDLRQLPALVSVASAGGVALFWLDKLPDRGRRALSERAPLGALLADRSVAKAGVGASMDARKLEAFGEDCVVRSPLDLGDGAALADLARSWLGRDLKKRKSRRRRDTKRSHWRAPDLTAAMRAYAAEDAACARDVHAATTAAADPDG